MNKLVSTDPAYSKVKKADMSCLQQILLTFCKCNNMRQLAKLKSAGLIAKMDTEHLLSINGYQRQRKLLTMRLTISQKGTKREEAGLRE